MFYLTYEYGKESLEYQKSYIRLVLQKFL
jgi:hypothetical protein